MGLCGMVNREKAVWFSKNDLGRLAEYLVELTKLGAGYVIEDAHDGWHIEITGY